jgi:hypothetical protein
MTNKQNIARSLSIVEIYLLVSLVLLVLVDDKKCLNQYFITPCKLTLEVIKYKTVNYRVCANKKSVTIAQFCRDEVA